MATLTILAHIKVKADKVEFIKAELQKLIPITKAEEGCLRYDLHQDNKDPSLFVFYEDWQNRDLWKKHMNNQHLKEYLKKTEGAVEKFTVHELTLIG